MAVYIYRFSCVLLFILCLSFASNSKAKTGIFETGLSLQDRTNLRLAVKLAKSEKWEEAADKASEISNPLPVLIVQWMKFQRSKNAEWSEIFSFYKNHHNWPRSVAVMRNAERVLPSDLSTDDIFALFKYGLPRTGRGMRMYGEAKIANGEEDIGKTLLRRGWIYHSIFPSEFKIYHSKHKEFLKNSHEARLDELIWKRRFTQAKRMYPFVSEDWQKLSDARIALMQGEKGVDGKINRISDELQQHEGLAFARLVWRLGRDRDDEAANLLLETSRRIDVFSHPNNWAKYRLRFSRDAFESGNYKQAYELAAKHGLFRGADFAGLEFFAGWIALQKLNDPKRAYRHFKILWDGVQYPISKSRAAYWAARAQSDLGNKKDANSWYNRASNFNTSFYGILANEKLGNLSRAKLEIEPEQLDLNENEFLKDMRVRAAIMLESIGETTLARRFVVQISRELEDPEQFQIFAELTKEMGQPHFSVLVGKYAARKNISLIPY